MKFWSIFTKIVDVLVTIWNVVRGQIPGNQQNVISKE